MFYSSLKQAEFTLGSTRNIKRIFRGALSALLASSVLVACGGDGGSGSNSSTSDGSSSSGDGTESTVVQIGNGLGSNFQLGEIGIQNPNLQSGGTTELQLTFVDEAGNAVIEPLTALVSSNCVASDLATLEGDLDTITGGITLDYTANGCSGSDVISASVTTTGGQTITATGTINIEPDSVLSVQFVSASPTELSLRGVGGAETAKIVFRLVGQQSAPIVGEDITFSVSTEAGGISLAETSAVSDNTGEVTAIVQSGTVHTTVVVTATHTATNVSGTSAGINISTGVPQSNRLSLALDSFNPRAFDFNGAEVVASIIAADQFGNPVPNGTVISFASPEGGTIPPSCSTIDGVCESTWISSNPRPLDGRASIIAFTSGAEEFTDINGNSVFDDGDVFTSAMDLAEPFVDENENGVYDAGEYFFDFNSNGVIDFSDGLWNGPLCGHSSLCSPIDEIGIYKTAVIDMATNGVQVLDSGALPAAGGSISVEAGSTTFFNGMMLADLNGNSMANGTEITFEISEGGLIGSTTYSIGGSTTLANGPFLVAYQAPVNPAADILTLKVDVPEVSTQEFFWFINSTCSAPTAPQVTNITDMEAVISWLESGNATSWNVEFGPEDFIEGTGQITTTANPHVLDGLVANQSYDFYVRALCGSTPSESVGPTTFTTLP